MDGHSAAMSEAPKAADHDEVRAMEAVLLDYVRRYGLTTMAREYFMRNRSGDAVDDASPGDAKHFDGSP